MTTDTSNAIITAFVAIFVPLATGLLAIGLAWTRQKLGLQQQQTSLQADQTHNAAIQAAVTTAVGIYASKGKDAALAYVASQVPDAVAYFGLSGSDIATRVLARVAVAAGVAPPPA